MLTAFMGAPRTAGKRFLVIGNPENRRVRAFAAEAARAGAELCVVAWRDVIARAEVLLEQRAEPCFVRIESWGESSDVQRALLRRGLEVESAFVDRARLTEAEIAPAMEEYGRIVAPRQAHDGVLAVLGELESVLAQRPEWRCLQPLAAIRTLFDKAATHRLARELDVPVPKALPPVALPEALFAEMDRESVERVYVKLGCSSSASCLGLLERLPRSTSFLTSVEVVGERLYNSLTVRRYARPEIVERVLRFLLAEGAHVEHALEKRPSAGRHADVRLLVVPGTSPFALLRTSATPITNLHLGGRRGDLELYRAKLPQPAWAQALAAGARLAAALGVWHLGVDVAFERATGAPFVLEANAFGDLLPGLERDGSSVYAWEIQTALARA